MWLLNAQNGSSVFIIYIVCNYICRTWHRWCGGGGRGTGLSSVEVVKYLSQVFHYQLWKVLVEWMFPFDDTFCTFYLFEYLVVSIFLKIVWMSFVYSFPRSLSYLYILFRFMMQFISTNVIFSLIKISQISLNKKVVLQGPSSNIYSFTYKY